MFTGRGCKRETKKAHAISTMLYLNSDCWLERQDADCFLTRKKKREKKNRKTKPQSAGSCSLRMFWSFLRFCAHTAVQGARPSERRKCCASTERSWWCIYNSWIKELKKKGKREKDKKYHHGYSVSLSFNERYSTSYTLHRISGSFPIYLHNT